MLHPLRKWLLFSGKIHKMWEIKFFPIRLPFVYLNLNSGIISVLLVPPLYLIFVFYLVITTVRYNRVLQRTISQSSLFWYSRLQKYLNISTGLIFMFRSLSNSMNTTIVLGWVTMQFIINIVKKLVTCYIRFLK